MHETLAQFLQAYLVCMLWSSTETLEENGREIDRPLDDNYGVEDIAPETLKRCEDDCRDFLERNAEDLALAYVALPTFTVASAGHDFWLTRNRHGAGFWDRGLGAVGTRLSEAARTYGETDPYVGDDGLVYLG